MRPQSFLFAVLVPLIVLAGAALVAQQAPSDSKTPPSEPQLQKHFYQLTFRLRESDDGKDVNQRDFILNINAAPVHVGGVPPTGGMFVPAPASPSLSRIKKAKTSTTLTWE